MRPGWSRHAGLRPGRGARPRALGRVAAGLRTGGVDGFLEAYGEPQVPEAFRETVKTVLRQRLSAHEYPDAVADALSEVPRSAPFEAWEDLRRSTCP